MAAEDILDKALDTVSTSLKGIWDNAAKKQGWSPKIANSVNVGVNHDSIHMSYPENMKDKINTLEYGDLATKTPPAAAIRSFEKEAENTVIDTVSAITLGILTSKLLESL
jgi:hypothetical protein